MSVSISWKFPQWMDKLKAATGTELQLFVAAIMQLNRGMMFDKEGAHNGHRKWAKLKSRAGQILSDRGTLRRSIAPQGTGRAGPGGIVKLAGNIVTIGTNLAYAPMMNWGTTGLPGGVLRPVRAKALRFKVGGKIVFAQQVKIPARRFDTWNNEDKLEMTQSLTAKVSQILNREG